MITLTIPATSDLICQYATSELRRLLTLLTDEPVECNAGNAGRIAIDVALEPQLAEQEISVESHGSRIVLRGGSPTALLHGVYTLLEQWGAVFEFSGEVLPPRRGQLPLLECNFRHTPSIRERGIRMHLNFVQDQSFFTEEEFATFIDNMARQRWNYLLFHMYTPQQWFPFTYRDVRHLDLTLGNLNRKPLSPEMIGREKVHTNGCWYPREFEEIEEPEALLNAVYGRFQRMMHHAHTRGIRNCVSFEPESLPPAMVKMLPTWSWEESTQLTSETLSHAWQEDWSGVKLTEADIRHPLVIDIAVERCLQCIDAFPDLDELQLISREGANWHPKPGESYAAEIARLRAKFQLPEALFDEGALATVVQPNDGPEMHMRAHPYWTVLPGSDFYPTVIGALRFVEYALAILADQRVQDKMTTRQVESSIAVYSPNPNTVRLMMPIIAAMLPAGTRFHCLADYSAHDIAANLPAWQPLADANHRIGVISWLEFDGLLTLAQGWNDGLCENVRKAVALGTETMMFNHWRVRSLEHNAAIATACCWDATPSTEEITRRYFMRRYGAAAVQDAIDAHTLLEAVSMYGKANTYNIGFIRDWVIQFSTEAPGYYWQRLVTSRQQYSRAATAFRRLAASATGMGNRQAQYLADLCHISALHIEAVAHLQNAKLPLYGYRAWPLGNAHACWPPPERLAGLVDEAECALALEQEYMTIYAQWVSSSDEQGQLCMHHQGVIEPFHDFASTLVQQLEHEKTLLTAGVICSE